jgi:hypothetical protein
MRRRRLELGFGVGIVRVGARIVRVGARVVRNGAARAGVTAERRTRSGSFIRTAKKEQTERDPPTCHRLQDNTAQTWFAVARFRSKTRAGAGCRRAAVDHVDRLDVEVSFDE